MKKLLYTSFKADSERYTLEVWGDASITPQEIKVRDVKLIADEITWLIDKIQASRLSFDILVSDVAMISKLVAGNAIIKVYRNNLLMWAGWLDGEGIEYPMNGKERGFVALNFGDFNMLKLKRFSRRGIIGIKQIVNEAFGELGVAHNLTENAIQVDTNLLDYDATYYDAIELCCEALVVTATQFYGVRFTNPADDKNKTFRDIDKIRGEHNSMATSKLISTIEFELKEPNDGGKMVATPSTIRPDTEKRETWVDPDTKDRAISALWGISTPSSYATPFDTFSGKVLGVRIETETTQKNTILLGDVLDFTASQAEMYFTSVGSSIIGRWTGEGIDRYMGAKKVAPIATFETSITPIRNSEIPMRLKISQRGGVINGGGGVQGNEKYAPLVVVKVKVEILGQDNTTKYTLRGIEETALYSEKIKEVTRYEWTTSNVTTSVYFGNAGLFDSVASNVLDAWTQRKPSDYGEGIALPEIPQDIHFARIRVTLYSGFDLVHFPFASNEEGKPIPGAQNWSGQLSKVVLSLLSQHKWYIGVEGIGVTQKRQQEPTDVTAYLDVNVSEAKQYSSRILNGVGGVSTYTNFEPNTTPLQYLRLFDSLYTIYGERGQHYSITHSLTSISLYYTWREDELIQAGYSLDLSRNRATMALQCLNRHTYNGEKL